MGSLSDWWKKLTGRAEKPVAAPRRKIARKPRGPGRQQGLSLADDAPVADSKRHGSAGFDPYSSDAGHAKPHSWERIDHD